MNYSSANIQGWQPFSFTLATLLNCHEGFMKKGIFSTENGLNVQRIEISRKECHSDVNVYFLQQSDSKIILPFECANKARPLEGIAKLFIGFPLLGTEDWGTNFIYHADFYPLEKRNGIVLPCDNSEVQAKYKHNVNTLQRMNNLLFDYLKEYASHLENSSEISKIDFLSHKVDDSKTKEFFKSQQEVWTKTFRSLPLIDTPLGRKSFDDGIKIPNGEICRFFARKDETYFEVFYEIASSAGLLLPNKDVCLKWADIIHQWALTDESQHEISLADVARSVTDEVDKKKLHKLIETINGCNQSDLLKDIPLIPNREGNLMVVGSLRDGKYITDELYKRAFLICAEDMKKMVHPDFTDIYCLTEYTRDDLRKSVSTVNENAKKETVEKGMCFSDEYTKALRDFSSIFSTENPTSNRYQIMKSLSILKGFELVPCYIPKVDEKESDYCNSSFIYLLESELLDISKKSKSDKNWFSNHKQNLLEFLIKMTLIKEKDKFARLLGSNGYAVVPNQLGILCKLEALKKRDEQISDKLADLYKNVQGKDLRENWIDADFSELLPDESGNKDKAKDVALEVETSLLDDYDKSHQVSPYILDIIQNIELDDEEAKLWKFWFKRIDEKKADINWNMVPTESKPSFYRLMKVAADKNLLDDLADISENTDIFRQFKNYMRARQQEEYEFEFKKQLGQKIECLVQEKLKRSLGGAIDIACDVEDCQGGQDMVVRLEGDVIYYIECKAKWNFEEPARMSKFQIRRAYNEHGHYALCAVDMSSFNGAIKDSIPSIDEIEKYIHVHLNVIDELSVDIESLLAIETNSNENKISISIDYKLNMPQSVFVNNIGFDRLIDSIISVIKEKQQLIKS